MFPNIPKKTTSMIQVWVSVLLVVLALVMSFMPIIKISTSGIEEKATEIFGENSDVDFSEIPESVDITAPNLISSVILFTKIGAAAFSDSPEAEVESLSETVNDEDAINAFATAVAIVSIFSDTFDSDISDDEILPMVFNILVSVVSLLYLLVMTIVFPIMLIIKAIITLVVALKNIKTPENATAKVGSKLNGLLGILFIIMLFQCALPGVSYGAGALGMLIITIVSIVLNAVAVRLPAYRKEDMIYANIVQGISLVGIIGFLVFFFNLINTGIVKNFLNGTFFTFLTEASKHENIYPNVEVNYIVDAILMIAYLVFIFISIGYISKVTQRFSLSAKNGATLLALPILSLPVFILPTVIKSSENLTLVSNGETLISATSLNLTEKAETALIFVLVGIIIMLLAEIAYLVLPKVLCKNMTKDDKLLVLSGNAPDPNAKSDENADAEEITVPEAEEEAPTEEANAEEAPAEEANEEIFDEQTAENASTEEESVK